MKIPLEYNKDKTRMSVTASINVENRGIIPVVFIIDTGSPETFVDEFNTSKMRIFTKNLEFYKYVLMGGTKVSLFKLGKATLSFRDEKEDISSIEYPNLKVAQTAWTRNTAVYTGTSILGLDFLLKVKGSLFLNPDRNIAYIEV